MQLSPIRRSANTARTARTKRKQPGDPPADAFFSAHRPLGSGSFARLRHPHSGGVFHRPLNRSGTTIQKGRIFLAESKHYHPIVGFASSRVKWTGIPNLSEVPLQLTSSPGFRPDQSTLERRYARSATCKGLHASPCRASLAVVGLVSRRCRVPRARYAARGDPRKNLVALPLVRSAE